MGQNYKGKYGIWDKETEGQKNKGTKRQQTKG